MVDSPDRAVADGDMVLLFGWCGVTLKCSEENVDGKKALADREDGLGN